ncbi:unnamed protein product [Ixodes hexagonus]
MSDEPEQVKKKYEIALAMAATSSVDIDIEAAGARVRAIKRQLVMNNILVTAIASSPRTVHRYVWAYPRNGRWFEETLPNLGGQNFRQSFRVSQTTFRYLVDVCRPHMERQATNMREPVPIEKRVAVGLYKLCSSAEDRTVAHLFDIGRSTVNVIYREFCETVVAALESRWVKMVTADDMPEHMREFQAACGFPQAIGALDGCHFPVSPPKQHASDYYNYKGWHSVILLALVDQKYRFRYINVGSPGRCHDAHVFRQSSLAQVVAGPTFRGPAALIGGTSVPPLILCDQAFPLTPNLMKPFPGSGTSGEQRTFNYHLSKSRRIVENAFGRLKARFRFVMKRMECHISHVPLVIRACCVLNNVGEHFNDFIPERWLNETDVYNELYPQPTHTTDAEDASGPEVRAALVRYFNRPGLH